MPFQLISDSSLSAIVGNVAAMVGYPTPTDAAGSTDPAVAQMVQATNMAGIDLLSMYDWQELVKPYQISISADSPGQTEKAFALPEDFFDWIDQTNWNATNQLPSLGPVARIVGSHDAAHAVVLLAGARPASLCAGPADLRADDDVFLHLGRMGQGCGRLDVVQEQDD
jgi:hypothetical protein